MAITEIRSNHAMAEKSADSAPKRQEVAEKTYKNAKEYSDYLSGKYSCLQGTKDSSVGMPLCGEM